MHQFENNIRIVLGYPILLLVLMWSVYLMDFSSGLDFYKYGVYPRSANGLFGVLASPMIHSQDDVKHILSNSLPIAVLLASLIHFYRAIASKILLIVWLGAGIGTWMIARENYHIGMSGVIYGLVGFLFTSGALRKYKPLMGLSLFVIFIYGSLIWGIFPTQTKVSWEGHLSGLVIGVVSAFVYRREGPQSPKFRYEIEKELGIEPVDYEKLWRESLAREEEVLRSQEQPEHLDANDERDYQPGFTYTYIVTKKISDEETGGPSKVS